MFYVIKGNEIIGKYPTREKADNHFDKLVKYAEALDFFKYNNPPTPPIESIKPACGDAVRFAQLELCGHNFKGEINTIIIRLYITEVKD